MVLDDVDVLGLDAKRLDRVLRPTAVGAWNLSVVASRTTTNSIGSSCTNSISATLGAAGQSNYVVANYLLEALVAHRRQRGLPALSSMKRSPSGNWRDRRAERERLQDLPARRHAWMPCLRR